MTRWIKLAGVAGSLIIAVAAVRAEAKLDLAHGERLHSAHCTNCHGNMTGGDGSALYTRKPRLVNSMRELKARVRRCESKLNLHWDNADVADVVYYLNQRYYQFDR